MTAELEHAERRLRAVSDAYQAAQAEIESLRQHLEKAYRQLSNMHPADTPNRAAHNQRCADEARETLRGAIGRQ